MTLDPGARRVNRAILKANDGHLPGTLGAYLAQRDDWETPRDLFAAYDHDVGFTLDPCANMKNRVCGNYIDREADGLRVTWGSHDIGAPARVWLHPPHSEPWMWVRKAVIETEKRAGTCGIVVALLPARTGDGWWHDFVVAHARSIRFLRGTPKFRLRGLPLEEILKTDRGRPAPLGGFALAVFQSPTFKL